jgi:DNA-binding transcriptional LysR family regulator
VQRSCPVGPLKRTCAAQTNAGVRPSVGKLPHVTSDNADVALQLAIAGGGIARLGDVIVGEPIRRGLLVPLLTDLHQAESLPIWALYLAGRHRLPTVRVFLDFLVEKFGSAPWRIEAQTYPICTMSALGQKQTFAKKRCPLYPQ